MGDSVSGWMGRRVELFPLRKNSILKTIDDLLLKFNIRNISSKFAPYFRSLLAITGIHY